MDVRLNGSWCCSANLATRNAAIFAKEHKLNTTVATFISSSSLGWRKQIVIMPPTSFFLSNKRLDRSSLQPQHHRWQKELLGTKAHTCTNRQFCMLPVLLRLATKQKQHWQWQTVYSLRSSTINLSFIFLFAACGMLQQDVSRRTLEYYFDPVGIFPISTTWNGGGINHQFAVLNVWR